jgi:hypothetical protein
LSRVSFGITSRIESASDCRPVAPYCERPLTPHPILEARSVHVLWIFALSLLVLPAMVQAQDLRPLPWAEEAICPFECCRLGPWTTGRAFLAFENERDPSQGTFEVPAGAAIVADSANMYTTSLGIAVMQERADVGRQVLSNEPLILEKGSAVIYLGKQAEALPTVLIQGRRYDAMEFWWDPAEGPRPEEYSESFPALLIQPLTREWWVRFQYQGRTGWVDAFAVPMQGSDGCG